MVTNTTPTNANPTAPIDLRVDIVSDIVCPWCIVGWKNFAGALAILRGQVSADVHWQPFELNPDMAPEGEDATEHIQRKYGSSRAEAEASQVRMKQAGEQAGFSFEWQGSDPERPLRLWNTFNAHRLLERIGADHGSEAQTRMAMRLFKAVFQERVNVSEPSVLTSLAESEGFSGEDVAAALSDPQTANAVRAAEQQFQAMGIRSVPTYIIDGRAAISGGQPSEQFAQALLSVAQEKMASA